ncbi:hypothetical protein AMTRI_Chr01g134820 [Amborella trichopoda]
MECPTIRIKQDGPRGGSGRNLSWICDKAKRPEAACAVISDSRLISVLVKFNGVNHLDLESTSRSSTQGFILQMSCELGHPARDQYQSYTLFSPIVCHFFLGKNEADFRLSGRRAAVGIGNVPSSSI